MSNPISRRDFFKTGVVAGITIHVSLFATPAPGTLVSNGEPPPADWLDGKDAPRFRVDAIQKVTGAKTFTRDFRARDLEGWPREQSHAFLIRVPRADRIFEGVDLSTLGDDLLPDRLVLAEDLQRDGISMPHTEFYGEWFLVPKGKTPHLLGEPVALLVYKDFARFDAAKRRIQFDEGIFRFGAVTGPNPPPNYGAARYVRIEGASPDAPDENSPIRDSIIFAGFKGEQPQWPAPSRTGDAMARGMAAAMRIEQEFAAAGDDALLMRRSYTSQSIDASAMETENGNVWYDPATQSMNMMIATQSPYEVAERAAEMLAKSKFVAKKVALKCGHTVGYGTKDHAVFPLYAVVAGLYGEGRPVRLAMDRFEQFQMGLKRHAFWMKYALLVDRKTHRFRAMQGEFKCDGGGRANYSMTVGMVGATAAQSIYYLPRSDFSVATLASRAVEAGSMRGFGTLQTMSATEMLVDEAAQSLGIDAIDLRLKNVFRTGMKNTQGAVPIGALRNDEILERAKVHPLWTERAARKVKYELANPGKRYGVGFAHVQKDYGTGGEAAIATLEVDREGRVTLRHVATEIGTGTTTSQPIIAGRILGRVPDRTFYGVVDWPEMPLTASEQQFTMSQAMEDRLKQNPRWTPSFTSPMSASNSAFFLGHATRESAHALVRFGLWPAALRLWGLNPASVAPLGPRDLHAVDGKLVAGSLEPLSFARVAATAHELGLVTGVSVHTFNRWEWAEAEFDVPDAGRLRLPVDALALRYGAGASASRKSKMKEGGYHFIDRAAVFYPPTQFNNAGTRYYAPMATLVEVAVNLGTGKVDVLSHHSILDPGPPIVAQLISGQVQGGIAMGIGHALHEYLPLYEDGPGNGTWNWNRYQLPRASDVAVWNQSAESLEPKSPADLPKGMAEVTVIAVIPAIANAVHHAIGVRFYDFPITPDKIKAALS
ncbi:MAG TPA: molybdopterin cofactor-binding domain-containing protein [Steroidobacteraceae bacterium]|nr:molybdopterin cofactor-binding domain-containing protein [Steroidobacteraceae bacterium]